MSKLKVLVEQGIVRELRHLDGSGSDATLWHIERHDDGTFSGGAKTKVARNVPERVTLDDIIAAMPLDSDARRRYRTVMELPDVTEYALRKIGFDCPIELEHALHN